MNSSLPLCVDCDGTLLRTDLLHESVLVLVKRRPLSVFLLPFWLLRGKAYLKQRIAERVRIDVGALPYDERVLALVRDARAAGRTTVLATASPRGQADAVAAHLALFDVVVATDGGTNVSGSHKAERLETLYGRRGFVYAGNSRTDLPVWEKSGGAIVVGAPASLAAAAAKLVPVLAVLSRPAPSLRPYAEAIRVHQWLKNLLVFVPLLAAHRLDDPRAVWLSGLAFGAFCLCASAVYVINDLLDLAADRAHERKRNRAFASGAIPVAHGIVLAPLLLGLAIGVATQLPPLFALALLGYFVATCLYSFWLKNQVIVDIMLLASLYTVRILAGAAATSIVPSFWLLAFSMFLFLSLATVKRYSEMLVVLQRSATRTAGRGYFVSDLPVLLSLGTSAGYSAILILALYVNGGDTASLYANRWPLWLVPGALLYWISRIWMKTHRGEMHDDPVVFAATDRQSWALAIVVAIAVFLAS
jgi:4-hydroxybenzoate polyprenyltransferase